MAEEQEHILLGTLLCGMTAESPGTEALTFPASSESIIGYWDLSLAFPDPR